MLVTNLFFFIDQHQGRNATQLEQVPFLPIQIGHLMFWVGQAEIRDFIFVPIIAVGFGGIWTNTDDFCVTRSEGCILIAQAREMGAAEGSHEPAQENQNDVFPALEARKPDGVAFEIGQFKTGGDGKDFHGLIPFRKSRTACINSAGFSSWGT